MLVLLKTTTPTSLRSTGGLVVSGSSGVVVPSVGSDVSDESDGSVESAEPFLQEWPIKIDITGPPEALTAILDMLTDPRRPTAMGSTSWKQVARKEGLVKGEFKLYSVRVRPAASLGLEKEEG